jgi:hypothetical protein
LDSKVVCMRRLSVSTFSASSAENVPEPNRGGQYRTAPRSSKIAWDCLTSISFTCATVRRSLLALLRRGGPCTLTLVLAVLSLLVLRPSPEDPVEISRLTKSPVLPLSGRDILPFSWRGGMLPPSCRGIMPLSLRGTPSFSRRGGGGSCCASLLGWKLSSVSLLGDGFLNLSIITSMLGGTMVLSEARMRALCLSCCSASI